MNIIEYEHGDGTVDYAPESYMNIGVDLATNASRDARIMNTLVNPQPSGWPIYDERYAYPSVTKHEV